LVQARRVEQLLLDTAMRMFKGKRGVAFGLWVSHQSAVSSQQSAVSSQQSSIVSYQSSGISHQSSVINH
jgi:hypothetical protein